MEALQQREWRRLEETLRRGKCVLMLGADPAVDPADPSSLPLSSQFAAHLAGQLDQTPADPHDLPLVAHSYLHESDRFRVDLEIEAAEFYERFAGQTTATHLDLAALPFHLCVTVTPDGFMTEAFRQSGKEPTTAYYDISARGHRPAVAPGSPERPIVYGLFGNVAHPPSLVLTETDLLELVVAIGRGGSAIPDYVAAEIADPHTAFLFLGFGFQHWYTRILLHVLKTYGHRTRSLALEGEAFFSHPERACTALFFEQASSIIIRREGWREFAAELRRRCDDLDLTREQPSGPVPEGGPKVFLCHDSRDGELVAELGRRLNALGVATWRDAQNLRGADDWDRQIEHVLNRQVDFIVVCETPGMVAKGESYFHKEIQVALERQKRFPDSTGFVWPVTLRPGAELERLAHLHRIDITTDEGVRRLAAQLIEAWQAKSTERDEVA